MVWDWIPLVVGGTVGAIGGFIVAGPFGAGAEATAGAALAYGSTGRKDRSHHTHRKCHLPAMVSWTNERLCSKVDQEVDFLFWLVFRSKKGGAFARQRTSCFGIQLPCHGCVYMHRQREILRRICRLCLLRSLLDERRMTKTRCHNGSRVYRRRSFRFLKEITHSQSRRICQDSRKRISRCMSTRITCYASKESTKAQK
jgi:hypothetical protein